MKTTYVTRIFAVLAAGAVLWLAGCDGLADFGGEDTGGTDLFNFYVSAEGSDTNDGGSVNTPFRTLSRAYDAALASRNGRRVYILSDLEEAGPVTLDAAGKPARGNTAVSIEGFGGRRAAPFKIRRSEGTDGSVVEIQGGANVTFSNITIDGKPHESEPVGQPATSVYKPLFDVVLDHTVKSEPGCHRALAVGGAGTEVTLGSGVTVSGKKNGYAYSGMKGVAYYEYPDQGVGIRVYDGARLVLGEGSAVANCDGTSSGYAGCYAAVVVQSDAVLEMRKGSRVYANHETGGVLITSSRFTMDGGEISGNDRIGVSLYRGSSFTMNSGEISGNLRGGIAADSYNEAEASLFTMNGGRITGNTALPFPFFLAGGVEIRGNVTFEMNDGRIDGNTGGGAGGVFLVSGQSSFVMNGGQIDGNASSGSYGGGVSVFNGVFTMKGGEISGNTTDGWGGGVSIIDAGHFVMEDGEIYGNTAAKQGGGVALGINSRDEGRSFKMTGGIIYGSTGEKKNTAALDSSDAFFRDNVSDANVTPSELVTSNATIDKRPSS
jgi:hypothetical protein